MTSQLIPLTEARREEIVRLANEIGNKEASRRSGVAESTIRVWKSRLGLAQPPKGDGAGWARDKLAASEDAWEVAGQALRSIPALIKANKMADAQKAALAMAIVLDKSAMLETASANMEERHARLSNAQGVLMFTALERFFALLDLPFGDAARALLANLLQQPADAMTAPDDLVAAARADLEAVPASVSDSGEVS